MLHNFGFYFYSTAQSLGTTATESKPTDPAPNETTTTEPPITTEPPTTTEPPMASRNYSCGTTGGWTKIANLDMTDPNQQCPDGFNQWNRNTAPLRVCNGTYGGTGCESTTFPVHGIEYSHVCGRVIGYQFGGTISFLGYTGNTSLTIDDPYVDGVSLTHGQSPRQHIWTFASAYIDYDPTNSTLYPTVWTASFCPCAVPNNTNYYNAIPPYIGNDYFCETGDHPTTGPWQLLADDPLWDGQGCGGNSTCCSFNNPPFFCKQLPQPTTDDIELRMCTAYLASSNAQTPLEIVEIYIK